MTTSSGSFYSSNLCFPAKVDITFFCYPLYEWIVCSLSSNYANGWQDFQYHKKQLVVKSRPVEVSLFETTYTLPYLGRMPWLKKMLRSVLGKRQNFGETCYSFCYLQWMLVVHRQWTTILWYIFSLPSLKVGRSPSVKVGDCFLFSTLDECW